MIAYFLSKWQFWDYTIMAQCDVSKSNSCNWGLKINCTRLIQ
uniref:Uncharacterized protein n=1 Tax=Arundo donax TaxID=35708 RepID=A0A0A8Z526_ARUDO